MEKFMENFIVLQWNRLTIYLLSMIYVIIYGNCCKLFNYQRYSQNILQQGGPGDLSG